MLNTPPDRTLQSVASTTDSRSLLVIWAAALILLPFYLLESGLPQPAHLMFGVAIVATYVRLQGYDDRFKPLIRAFGSLVFIIAVVTIVWAMIAPADISFFPPIYALFNFLVVRTALALYSHFGSRFLAVTAYTLLVVLIVIGALALITGEIGSFRSSGTFNNPNQRAYFVISASAIVTGINHVVRIDQRLLVLGYAASLFLIATSNSKAGILAMALIVVVVAFTNARVALVMLVLAIVLIGATQVGEAAYTRISDRVISVENDDTLEARGYLLLTGHPQYLITGAGEGYQDRFGFETEIHSTIGTIAFAYGIAGLAAFGLILWEIFRLSGLIGLAVVSPALAYGLSHNGLRFSVFWVLIAVAATLGFAVRQSSASADVEHSV